MLFSKMKQFQSPLEAEEVNISLCCYKRFSIAPKCSKLVKIIKSNNIHNWLWTLVVLIKLDLTLSWYIAFECTYKPTKFKYLTIY